MALLAACSAVESTAETGAVTPSAEFPTTDAERNPATTGIPTTTTVSPATSTPPTILVSSTNTTTTTTTTQPAGDPGTESIGVTDEITITIVDEP